MEVITDCSLTSFGNESEIDVRLPDGNWETIATIRSVAGMDADEIASHIVKAIKKYKTSNPQD
jgi:hypothetical protein